MKLYVLSITFILAACGSKSPQNPSQLSVPATNIDLSFPEETPVKSDGVVNGGGGFDDTYALETLEKIKTFLIKIVSLTSEGFFNNFPEEKRKEFIINLIKNIEYKNTYVERYGRRLKFDYDLEREKVFVTKSFIDTFPYGRFITMSTSQKDRVIYEVIYDILHEISHFYGVGVTEETDPISDQWAMGFMYYLGTNIVICEDAEKDFGLFFSKQLGVGNTFRIKGHERVVERMKSDDAELEDLARGAFFIPYALGEEFYEGNYKRAERFVGSFQLMTSDNTIDVEGYVSGYIEDLPLSGSDYMEKRSEDSRQIQLGSARRLDDKKIIYSVLEEGTFTAHSKGGPNQDEDVKATRVSKLKAIFDEANEKLTYSYITEETFDTPQDKELNGAGANWDLQIELQCKSNVKAFDFELTKEKFDKM